MSDSQDFQVQGNKNQFFNGLFVGSLLQAKNTQIRHQIAQNSQQKFKTKSLAERVAKRLNKNKMNNEQINIIEPQKVQIDIKHKRVAQSPKKKSIKKTFEQLRIIKPILKAISEIQYIHPTPIQQQAIPIILTGKDIVGSSVTGSGKTAAFLIPILQRYYNAAPVGYIRSMIVTPTRQLAIQIYQHFQMLNKYTRLDCVLAIGASSISTQEQGIRNHPQLIIATPGRIIDLLINSRSVGIENLQMIVFDEADKLLELGFKAQIQQIMSFINKEVQTILFSATMDKEVRQLVTLTTRKPVRISADPDNKTAEKLHQQVVKLRSNNEGYRQAVLLSLLLNIYKDKVIIFFKTKKQCHRMAVMMGLMGSRVCELHGNLSQSQRIDAFLKFKEGSYDYMMATDLASRGLDVKQVKTVINFELPTQLTRYIHRIGRTARAGTIGTSVTLCNDEECRQLKKMMRKTGDKLYKLNIQEENVQQKLLKIKKMENDLSKIDEEEKEERIMRKAQMELEKLQNINNFKNQIHSRPKKEWFLTEKQKRQIQRNARAQAGCTQPLPPPRTKKIRKFIKRKQKK